jgi:carbonic anhydrase/acetyltransferase-like protein (isoleucine patch superfamily)
MILPYNNIWPRIARNAFLVDNCDIIGDVEIGEQSSIWFGTVVRGDIHHIKIGNRTNIQDNSVVHVTADTAPTIIGNNVTVGHGAILHGCTVEDDCLIGMGSRILDNAVIGNHSMVAAGSVVLPGVEIPSGMLVAGIPAEIKRELHPDDIREIELSAQRYIDYFSTYLHGGYKGQVIPHKCYEIGNSR